MSRELTYHRHLAAIQAADLAYVRKKDAQYNASWKKRGGVGAWFTIVRPWDRLNNMVDPNEISMSEDNVAPISGAINHRVPAFDIIEAVCAWELNEGGDRAGELSGPDGSPIACIRDLRRYLLLLEAHCTEVCNIAVMRPSELSGTSNPPVVAGPSASVHILDDYASGEQGKTAVNVVGAGDTDKMYEWPWRISAIDYRRMLEAHAGGDAWRQLLPELYIIETSVPGAVYRALSPDIQRYFVRVEVETPTVSMFCYVIDLTHCPVDIRGSFPLLSDELNNKEHDDIQQEYRGMYDWHEGPNKWILRTEFHSWMKA